MQRLLRHTPGLPSVRIDCGRAGGGTASKQQQQQAAGVDKADSSVQGDSEGSSEAGQGIHSGASAASLAAPVDSQPAGVGADAAAAQLSAVLQVGFAWVHGWEHAAAAALMEGCR